MISFGERIESVKRGNVFLGTRDISEKRKYVFLRTHVISEKRKHVFVNVYYQWKEEICFWELHAGSAADSGGGSADWNSLVLSN